MHSVVKDSTAWDSSKNQWNMYLSLTESLKDVNEWALYLYDLQYSIDGGEKKSFTLQNGVSKQLYFSIKDDDLPQNITGKTLTIHGTIAVDKANTVGIHFIEPITLIGTVAGWALQKSEGPVDNLLSIRDLGEVKSDAGSSLKENNTLIIGMNAGRPKVNVDTVFGKSFRTYIEYDTTSGSSGVTWLYYGTANPGDSSNNTNTAKTNCVSVKRESDGKVIISLWSSENEKAHEQWSSKSVQLHEKYLLEIDISEKDSNNQGTVVVRFDGVEIIDWTGDLSGFGNYLSFYASGSKWKTTYYDYEEKRMEHCINEAEEIVALDFGLDGAYTEAASGQYSGSVDGKKLVLEVSDIIGGGFGSSEAVLLTYANMVLQLGADNKTVKVYTSCGKQLLGSYEASEVGKFKVEIYTEYVDTDKDGTEDALHALLRINEMFIDLEDISTSHCDTCHSTTKYGRWLCTSGVADSQNAELTFSSAADEDENVFSISDITAGGIITMGANGSSTYSDVSLIGKEFRTYITWNKAESGNGQSVLYYGLSSSAHAWKDCVTVRVSKQEDGSGQLVASIWGGTKEQLVANNGSQTSQAVETGKRYLLSIKIFEEDTSGSCEVEVRIDGEVWASATVDMTNWGNYMKFNSDSALYTPTYSTYKTIESYTISSLSTQVDADLTEGVLTISGKGTVLPSALNGVVADPTTVQEIVIESGITKVESGVFNGFTALRKVTYADTVTSVADNAFSGCSEGVEITCPIGTEFYGGLQNALIVKAVADIYIPNTGIVNPAVVVTRVTSSVIYQNLKKSSVAILDIDENLNVLDSEGETICTVADYMEEYKNTIIPAFYLDNAAEATTLCTYLSQNDIDDAYYMTSSENAGILETARTTYNKVRGILEYDELPETLKERGAHRRVMNNKQASVALYPSENMTADIVAEYNVRGLSVWSYANTVADVYAGISDGVNGLVSSNPATVINVYEGITEKTLSGKPIAMAHRGLNGETEYPEQTLNEMKSSVDLGVKALEMDIQLTKDEKLVVLGGEVFTKITGSEQKGTNASYYTLVEIQELGKNHDENLVIPSLNEVFAEYKNTDIALYLHINYITGNFEDYADKQIAVLTALIKEFEEAGHSIADNLVLFLRGGNTAKYRTEYGLSFIGGKYRGDGKDEKAWADAEADQYAFIKQMNVALSGTSGRILPFTYERVAKDDYALAYRMSARGYLTLQTANNAEDKVSQDDYFINKIGGPSVMTNHPEYASEYRYQINAVSEKLALNSTLTLSKKVNTVGDGQVNVDCGFISVSGDNILDANGKIVATGSAVVVYYADITLTRDYEGGLHYRIYSDPVAITAVEQLDLEGDMDGDFALTVDDLVDLKRAVSDNATDSKFDLNNDGKVDIKDLVVIRKKILNFIMPVL